MERKSEGFFGFFKDFWTLCRPVKIFDLSTRHVSVVPGVLTKGVKGSNRVIKKILVKIKHNGKKKPATTTKSSFDSWDCCYRA